MDFKVQRFKKGHPLYSDVVFHNNDPERGFIGSFQVVFGQSVDMNGKLIDYTMERLDTLIPCDTYEYDLYYSNLNKTIVPRLIRDGAGNDISKRELESHIANFPSQIDGCTAHGKLIDVKLPGLLSSGSAFHNLMALIGTDKGGKITYEYFEEPTIPSV
jgi:hypothetical protein